ncbi:PREDICTED: rapid alkalinization factor-like [Nicotiana attenuata]|uniref:Rapid alkalinization factor n=1 Tax=Nicotiana attenuata TaxID=49451 RepID=A0A314KVW7_NICAT|nr:PREDICTED: rapid alkalinization factor-like [Nicotiana attenuata]OIT33137.1 rapid alkalinization factor [Nicotiana attenuata]
MAMVKVNSFTILLISSIFLIGAAVAAATGAHELGFYPMTLSMTSSTYEGSIGELLAENGSDEEFSMESESTRRILAYRRRYISYGALSRNRVPCSRRGASYYNCRPGAQANPYRRGCSAITRCRR